jgi:hypothetical protein
MMVDRGLPSSADLFQVDFTGDYVIDAATAWHVFHLAIGRPPRGLSFTLPDAKARFPHPNIVAFLDGSIAKRSRNFTFNVFKPDLCHQSLLEEKPTQLGPIDGASSYLQTDTGVI